MNKIIAVVGMTGSGKSVACDFYENKGFKKVYFGGVTIDKIKEMNLPVNEENERIIKINHEYTYKLKKVLQDVKSIAKGVRGYLELPAPRDVRFEMDRILDLITETELPDQKEREA